MKLIVGRCDSRNERSIGLLGDGSIDLCGSRSDDFLIVRNDGLIACRRRRKWRLTELHSISM